MEWCLENVGHTVTDNISCDYERISSLNGATKVSEGSKMVLGGNGDVRILNVLNDSSLDLCGHVMPVFSCHTVPVYYNMPTFF
jgi:hypothetical protein